MSIKLSFWIIATAVTLFGCLGPAEFEIKQASSSPGSSYEAPPGEGAGDPLPSGSGVTAFRNECANPKRGWIFCDDFEQDRLSQYFEHDDRNGAFMRTSAVGVEGSLGMRARFGAGAVGAGSLKLAFGRTPSAYFRSVDEGTRDYREIYWRVYLRHQPGWTGGGGNKLSRATVFAGSNWSQAMIAHVWSGGNADSNLVLDPASGTDTSGNLITNRYNDFANLRWLGIAYGQNPLFDATNVGQWYCIEAHVRLNDGGQSNGLFELWIDGALDSSRTNLNFLGSYSAYGLNSVMLENFWNDGSPVVQERYFDNFIVSTQRIGCGS